jgi:hypothetical protein
MPRVPELEDDDVERWLIPCDCYEPHYFQLTWDQEYPEFRWADISYVRGNPGWGLYGLKRRFKDAWNAFSRSKNYIFASIVLNDKAIETLTEFIDTRWEKK